MTNILICAAGGASGNFIATLIRLFKNSQHLEYFKLSLPADGCADLLSASAGISEYTAKHLDVSIYPECSASADTVYTILSTVDLSLYGWKEFANDLQLNVIHYSNPEDINRFLTIDNLYIILIRTKESDADQIAINKLSKNFFLNDKNMERSLKTLNYSKKVLADGLIFDNFDCSAEYIKNTESLVNLPKQVKLDLMQSLANQTRLRSRIALPELHEKLLILNFDDIVNNKDHILDEIGKFIGCSVNDNLLQFYNEYISKQPTMESYLNC